MVGRVIPAKSILGIYRINKPIVVHLICDYTANSNLLTLCKSRKVFLCVQGCLSRARYFVDRGMIGFIKARNGCS